MSTTIEWTQMPGFKGETWNPVAAFDVETGKRGWFCTKPSAGCKNCYAEARNRHIGNGLRYAIGNTDKVRFEIVNLDRPMHWRKPRMVFVCSMTDLFLEQHTDEMIFAVFQAMVAAPRHVFQVLTKRPGRMRGLLERWIAAGDLSADQMKHIWFGTTTENQETADERIPDLLALRFILPQVILWLSCEPLLSAIDLRQSYAIAPLDRGAFGEDSVLCHDPLCRRPGNHYPREFGCRWSDVHVDGNAPGNINWVVPGGESGVKARECLLSWIESLVAQCELAGVPCFVKQLGRHPFDDREGGTDAPLKLFDKKGGKLEEWPESLRVRQWPAVRS